MSKFKLPGSTVDTAKMSLILSLAGLLLGMEISSLSFFLDKNYFTDRAKPLTALQQGLLISSNPLGGLIGCILYCFSVNVLSRKRYFQAGAILWISSCLSIVVLPSNKDNIWLIIISRFLKGITVGIYSVLLTNYINEVFPNDIKGRTMAIIQFSNNLSILLSYYLCITFNYFLNLNHSFKFFSFFEMIPAMLLFINSFLLPESPQWLTLKGDYENAIQVQNSLATNYNQKRKKQITEVMDKFDLTTTYGVQSDNNTFRFWHLFSKYSLRQTLMGFFLQLLIQFSGFNVLLYYMAYICQIIGLYGNMKVFAISLPYFLNMVLSVLPILFIEKIGRKDLTLVGSIPSAFIMYCIGLLMVFNGHEVQPMNGNEALVWSVDLHAGAVILSLCFLFVAIYSLTLSTSTWIYTTEILPTWARPKGFSICMLIGWFGNFMVTLFCPLLLNVMKWGLFITLGSLTLITSMIILVYFPETKDLSNEDINEMYCKDSFIYEKHRNIRINNNKNDTEQSPITMSTNITGSDIKIMENKLKSESTLNNEPITLTNNNNYDNEYIDLSDIDYKLDIPNI